MTDKVFQPLQWFWRRLLPLDLYLLLSLSLLLAFSYVMMISASPERLVTLQVHFALALLTMWVVAQISPQRLLLVAPYVYFIGVLLLLGVLFFGETAKGARRWLNLGVIRVQPSELLKIGAPLMLAWYFHQREIARHWSQFLMAAVLLAIPLGLILVQPDLGTSLLIAASGFYVIFFAGLSWRLIVPVVLVVLMSISALVFFGNDLCQPEVDWLVLRDYQKQRVCTLLDPNKDPLDKGFHTIQSTIAIGSGGVWGKGWKAGTQTHLAFIPERHTDFIFSVLAEELGLSGALILLTLYLTMIVRGFIIAARANLFGMQLLAGSISMIIFTYAFVNIGMVSGILPVVGVPLPFISYGGTALVTLCIGLGILMSIRYHSIERAET